MLFRSRRTSYRSKKREPDTIWRQVFFGVLGCLLVVLLASLVWYLTHLPFVTITTVTVQGGETVQAEVVEAKVAQVLRESYLRIIPYRFTYLYPHDRIVEALLDIHRINEVTVERVGRTELRVTYSEYAPYALWCTKVDRNCFFVDETGFAYEEAPRLEGGTLVRHTFEDGGEPARGNVVPQEVFRRSHTLIESFLRDASLRVTDVLYTDVSDSTFTVHGGGKILVSDAYSIEVVLENLLTILRSEEFAHLEPGNFNYIDLRFGNKVFVNEEFPSPDSGTTSSTTSSTSE